MQHPLDNWLPARAAVQRSRLDGPHRILKYVDQLAATADAPAPLSSIAVTISKVSRS